MQASRYRYAPQYATRLFDVVVRVAFSPFVVVGMHCQLLCPKQAGAGCLHRKHEGVGGEIPSRLLCAAPDRDRLTLVNQSDWTAAMLSMGS